MMMIDSLSLIGGIAAIVDLSKFIVQFAKDVGNATQERDALLEEITQTADLCQSLRNFLTNGDNKDCAPTFAALGDSNGPMERFKQLLESMKEELISSANLRARLGKVFKWPFEKSEMTEIVIKLEHFKTLCTLAIAKDHMGLSIAIQKELHLVNYETSLTNDQLKYIRQEVESTRGDIAKMNISEEDKNIRARLSSIDHVATHNDIRSRRANNTGQWFLNDPVFQSWDQGPSSILWCPGIPGSGKTILSSLVLDTFAQSTDEAIKVAGIYCTYKDPKSTLDLIGSLVLQLVEQHTEIPKSLKMVCQRNHLNLASLLDSLPEVFVLYSKIIFIVDALDECNDRKPLLSTLQGLLKSETGTTIHILITSRPIDEIEKELSNSERLTIRGHEIDLRTYLQQRLHDGSRLTTFVERDPQIENEIINAVLKNVDGMFLLAHLRINMLAQKLSVRKLLAALSDLPKELDLMYDEAVNRIQTQNEDQRHVAVMVLSWITHASRSFKIQELQHALAIEEGDTVLDETGFIEPNDLTSFCAGLVIIDEGSDTVALVHPTTQEYFQRRKHSLFPEANLVMAQTCINYLCLDVFKVEGSCATPNNFRRRIDKYHLFSYAAENWGNHVRATSAKEIHDKIITFLQHDSARFALTQAILWYVPHGFGGYPPMRGVGSFVDEESAFLQASFQSSPLHVVSFFGLESVANLLIHQGDQIDQKDELGTTPLYWALLNKQCGMVRFLLEQKADVNITIQNGLPIRWAIGFNGCSSPLAIATSLGDVETMKLLLDVGAQVEGRNDTKNLETACSALDVAAFKGRYDAVKLLLNRGANVDKVLEGYTGLIFTDKAILSLLIEAGLSKDKLLDLMSHAARWGQENLLLEILQCGVDVNGYGEFVAEGRTPLLDAVEGVEHAKMAVMKLLMEYGADVNRICRVPSPKRSNDCWGPRGSLRTPLMSAAYRWEEDVVRFLLQEGALAALDVGEKNTALSCTFQYSTDCFKKTRTECHDDLSFAAITIKLLIDHSARLEQCLPEDQEMIRQVVVDAIKDSNMSDDDYLEKFGYIDEDSETDSYAVDSAEFKKKKLYKPRPSNSWRTPEFLALMNISEKL